MNVLIVGSGKGSWEMRGKQLGEAIGARVTSAPAMRDWDWADVVVLVKRAGTQWCLIAHEKQVPIVWDAVDFWAQPFENGADEKRALSLLRNHIAVIRPASVIGSTRAMADACGGHYLPHHSWRGLAPQKPQREVKIVGYQGNPVYLGAWRAALGVACARRGWGFAYDALSLGGDPAWQSDILVALRDGPWDGWMCRHWKSGVKLVNAIAAGRPVITQATAAYTEIAASGSVVDSVASLEAALDTWSDYGLRLQAYEQSLEVAPGYRLPAIAEQFRVILTATQEGKEAA